MFLAAYGDDAQALAMAKYAWNELKLRHVALWVDESSVYTRTVGGYFEEFFRTRPARRNLARRTSISSVPPRPTRLRARLRQREPAIAAAIERAGSIRPDAVRAALTNTRDFEGLVGKIAYSPGKRVPDKAVAVIKIDDGVETLAWTWMPQSQ